MNFWEFSRKFQTNEVNSALEKINASQVESAIYKENPSFEDLIALLSPAAENYLEEMAQRAYKLTLNFFGRAKTLYTPLYVSDYCDNNCLYCAFKIDNSMPRTTLSLEDVEQEAKAISETGLRHILLLTGESRKNVPIDYLEQCVDILTKYFSSVAIEIYPLSTDEYLRLIDRGVDGLTIYQETYDRNIYQQVHQQGPKKDYNYRLLAPERGIQAGMRGVNIGTLLGLGPWRTESFFTGLHAWFLLRQYPEAEISVSLPRLRPFAGETFQYYQVNDKNLVQAMLAMRIFLPSAGINISTRESSELRENLLPLGVTKMSAGAKTAVGSHTGTSSGESQFEIADHRNVNQIKNMLTKHGYQPVLKDWEILYPSFLDQNSN